MFKVFDEKLIMERKKEVFFKLEEGGRSECIRLILVDKSGTKLGAGNILRIDEDGLHLNTSIDSDAPFKLTLVDRRIYIVGDI